MRAVRVNALKADNSIYRYCSGELVLSNEEGCIVRTTPGNEIWTPTGLLWTTDTLVRSFFVFGARLNLLEIHEPDGTPRELYINVIAPMSFDKSEISYVDHELDVRKCIDDVAHLVDEDEFEEAIEVYGYAQITIDACRKAAAQGQRIAERWQWKLPSTKALHQFTTLQELE